MSVSATPDLKLLERVCPLYCAVATWLVHTVSDDATSARGATAPGFFVELDRYLRELALAITAWRVRRTTLSHSLEGPIAPVLESNPIISLLNTLDRMFSESRTIHDTGLQPDGVNPALYQDATLPWPPNSGGHGQHTNLRMIPGDPENTNEQRLIWLHVSRGIGRADRKTQTRLLNQAVEVVKYLKAFDSSDEHTGSSRKPEYNGSLTECELVRDFGQGMEDLHQALEKHWICTCTHQNHHGHDRQRTGIAPAPEDKRRHPHARARFSFHIPRDLDRPKSDVSTTELSVAFPEPSPPEPNPERPEIWRSASLRYEKVRHDLEQNSHITSLNHEKHESATNQPFQTTDIPPAGTIEDTKWLRWLLEPIKTLVTWIVLLIWRDVNKACNGMSKTDSFCSAIESHCNSESITIRSTPVGLDITKTEVLPQSGHYHPAGSLEALSHYLNTKTGLEKIAEVSRKDRFILALMLAYAYLYLGGGPWWPYDDCDFDVWFLTPGKHAKLDLRRPYLATYLHGRGAPKVKETLRLMNSGMPSLPLLGIRLLAIVTAREVTLDNINEELERRDHASFASDVRDAVKVCMGFRKTKERPELTLGRSFRSDPQNKEIFVKHVVLELQHALKHGYRVDVGDILLQSPDSDYSAAPPSGQLRSGPTPGPSTHMNRWCLHGDMSTRESINKTEKERAEEYMREMQSWRETGIEKGFIPAYTNTHGSGVRVAVIDTGARFSCATLRNVYGGRLKEFRSWLDPNPKYTGRQVEIDLDKDVAGIDADGHGTHSASVVLNATQDTNIGVYIAQVFRDREDKQMLNSNELEKTHARIAHAIKYAVNIWKVNVISMSFGFPDKVASIEKEIDRARKKDVLLLASASNSGGLISKAAWPARYDNVVCIYATDGMGNPYDRNPTASVHGNYAVLGTTVEGWSHADQNGTSKLVWRSGTSTATPLAASIAAILIAIMHHCKKTYLADPRAEQDKKAERIYEERLSDLCRASGMRKLFEFVAQSRRDYKFVAPWTKLIFEKEMSHDSPFIHEILKQL